MEARRRPHQISVLRVKPLLQIFELRETRAEAPQGHVKSRWRRQAVCKDAAARAAREATCSTAAPALRELRPSRLRQTPAKQRPAGLSAEHNLQSLAPTAPFSGQRKKLFSASEPNSVSFYWLERHHVGGPLLGTNWGESVTFTGDVNTDR